MSAALPKPYHTLKASTKPIHIEEGGTRSGKSYNGILVPIELLYKNKGAGLIVEACRVNGPALEQSIMRDFREILQANNWWHPDWKPSRRQYNLWGNEFNFFSIDEGYKTKGRKRHILIMDEANRFDWYTYNNLAMRTSYKQILLYNPDETNHWIYDKLEPLEDCELHRSTYKDNPLLSAQQIRAIEMMEKTDPWYWKVYGKGERAANKALIYKRYTSIDEIPKEVSDEVGNTKSLELACAGLDFGFSEDPASIVLIYKGPTIRKQDSIERAVYLKQILYKTGQTNPDLANYMKTYFAAKGIDPRLPIICDSSEPKSIEELYQNGVNAMPAQKGPDSVRQGIQF